MLLTRYLAPMDTCVRWTLNFMLKNCTSYMLLRSTKNLIPLMVNISHWDNLKRFHKFFFPDKDRKQNKMRTYAGLFFQIFSNTFVWSLSLFFSALESHILSEIHLRFLANGHFTYWWDDSWYLRKVRRGTDKDWATPDRKPLMESEKAGEDA